MESKFKQLDTELEHKDTVVSFNIPGFMFKLNEFFLAIQKGLKENGFGVILNRLNASKALLREWNKWTVQGVDCEILQPRSQGWKKGKIRIKFYIELCSNEPDLTET